MSDSEIIAISSAKANTLMPTILFRSTIRLLIKILNSRGESIYPYGTPEFT